MGTTEISRVCAQHTLAVDQLALQGKTVFLDRLSYSLYRHGQGGGKATMGTTATKLGLAELRQAVERLQEADAQPAYPSDKKQQFFLQVGETVVSPTWRVFSWLDEKTLLKVSPVQAVFGNFVAKHPAFSSISPSMRLILKGRSKNKNNNE